MRGTAEAVARELIEQDQQGQHAFGTDQPFLVTAPCGGVMRIQKTRAELGIEGIIARKPALRTRRTPELHHRICRFHRYFLYHRQADAVGTGVYCRATPGRPGSRAGSLSARAVHGYGSRIGDADISSARSCGYYRCRGEACLTSLGKRAGDR